MWLLTPNFLENLYHYKERVLVHLMFFTASKNVFRASILIFDDYTLMYDNDVIIETVIVFKEYVSQFDFSWYLNLFKIKIYYYIAIGLWATRYRRNFQSIDNQWIYNSGLYLYIPFYHQGIIANTITLWKHGIATEGRYS